jgi:hypothetical protein
MLDVTVQSLIDMRFRVKQAISHMQAQTNYSDEP